ncbi:hypothetical protein MetMK1DRAFT_00024020 [Metallosphaera yellowstonensis MK1]|uniref:Uncharacterized protein n=1 Tax=Metallosphaera yellowstonensis MK1 TaxID=671065 RepID=H2C754_9CREN|nr:hypothetical protein MetMK1DRAFT_00024020 [Metallosphaera yellowstonensis MK1]
MLSYGPLKYLRIYVLSFTRFGASLTIQFSQGSSHYISY